MNEAFIFCDDFPKIYFFKLGFRYAILIYCKLMEQIQVGNVNNGILWAVEPT